MLEPEFDFLNTYISFYHVCSVLLEMQTRLQEFNSFSIGLLADLEMSEQQQNKVSLKVAT